MDRQSCTEHVQTVVIGGGQAGLSVGYHLSRLAIPFVVLEAHDRIGDSWRARWDSLKLFTPARYDGLDGMPFPAAPHRFPSKDEMAAYLESYAARFHLPVRTGTRVHQLSRQGGGYQVVTGQGAIEADHVVVAMASFQAPRVPEFARELKREIRQLHSSEYKTPAALRDGPVLIVGAGNSGAEIALEAAGGHRTWISGRDTGHVPFRIDGLPARTVLGPLVFRLVFHRLLTVRTPIGRRVRPKILAHGGPLIRVRPSDLAAAHVERVPRVVGARGGVPLLADGRTLDVSNIVWCTGFRPGFSWIDLPVFGDGGEPLHRSGVVTSEPGLYFVGLHFLHAFSSTMIHGVGRDARRIAETIATRVRAAGRQPVGHLHERPSPAVS